MSKRGLSSCEALMTLVKYKSQTVHRKQKTVKFNLTDCPKKNEEAKMKFETSWSSEKNRKE